MSPNNILVLGSVDISVDDYAIKKLSAHEHPAIDSNTDTTKPRSKVNSYNVIKAKFLLVQ